MFASFFHHLLHIDTYLMAFVATYGYFTYALLFLIIFCETGLVVTPFLPGDSLLFVAGSLAAQPNALLHITPLMVLLVSASFFGNELNYQIGRFVGPAIFSKQDSWLLNQKYLHEAHQFYEKYGALAIILARFAPVIRTFAPFAAGIATMNTRQFIRYNMISALLWVGILLYSGYFLGRLQWVSLHFSLIIYGIIICSMIPPVIAWIKNINN